MAVLHISRKLYIELGDEEKKALDDAVAGKSGDASVGPKVNEMLNADIDVEN